MKNKINFILVNLLITVTTCWSQDLSSVAESYSQNFQNIGNWGNGDRGGSIVVENGHLVRNQGSGSRSDISYNQSANPSNEADNTVESKVMNLNPNVDVFIAIKFIGNAPSSTLQTLRYSTNGTWGNKVTATGEISTTLGNTIQYWNLASLIGSTYTGDSYAVRRFQLINVGTDDSPDYSVDWVATFSSIEDIQTNADIADDGVNDFDEDPSKHITSTKLSDISIDGVTINGFDPNTTTYDLKLAIGTNSAPMIAAVTEDSKATIVITQAGNLPSTATVVVSAVDNPEDSTYTISFSEYEPQVTDKPNIIFLMTDDQRWDNMGCYGRPEFDTPNIDDLATEGVVFDNAAYAVAICMPSRVTMLTGRYLSNHKTGFAAPTNQTYTISDFANSYPAKLKEAGYRTGFVGKVHVTFTEERQRPTHSHPAEYSYKNTIGNVFDFFAGAYEKTTNGVEIWPEDDPGLKQIYQTGRSVKERTLKTGDAMLRFLETQPADEPFCLTTFFYAVKHDGNEFPEEHYKLFKDKTFSVPENYVEGANFSLPQVVQDYARGYNLHVQRTATLNQYQGQVREFATQGYSVDAQVGKLMKKLEDRGMLDNTIIIYTSDNGRFQGSHGLYDKALLYEESIKQPLIVFDGRKAAAERKRREAAPISSTDIAPTILSLAGVAIPDMMQGTDFSKVLDQTQDMSQWQDAVYIEDRFLNAMIRKTPEQNDAEVAAGRSYRARGVRTAKWKYFVYHEQNPVIEELYDLENDPQEQNNLINQPEYAAVAEELREKTAALYIKALGVENLSAGETTNMNQIQFYPNPIYDELTVVNAEGSTVNIYNLEGSLQLNYKVPASEKEKTVSLKKLSSGIYFLEFVNQAGVLTKKFIKK